MSLGPTKSARAESVKVRRGALPPPDVSRETMELDVLIVGGGSAGLSCALRLTQMIEAHNDAHPENKMEPQIAVIEKALAFHADAPTTPFETLRRVGGREHCVHLEDTLALHGYIRRHGARASLIGRCLPGRRRAVRQRYENPRHRQ